MAVLVIKNNMENNLDIKFNKSNQKEYNKNKIQNKNIKLEVFLVVNMGDKDKLRFCMLIENWVYQIKLITHKASTMNNSIQDKLNNRIKYHKMSHCQVFNKNYMRRCI
jgi:hypothetical protein